MPPALIPGAGRRREPVKSTWGHRFDRTAGGKRRRPSREAEALLRAAA
jgi:hypothetical protein